MGIGPLNSTANIMQLHRFSFVLAALATVALALPAWAHPGHGTTDPTSPSHAAEPVHLIPLVMLAVLVALGGYSVIRRMQRARVQNPKSLPPR